MKPKKPRPTGRPTDLTPALLERACELIRGAHTVEETCKRLGVGESTWYRWQQQGDEQPSGIYREFREGLLKAKAARVTRLEDTWIAAARTDWKAAAELLKVYEPKRFAPRVRVHIEEELTGALARIKARLPAQIYEAVLSALVEGARSGGAESAEAGESGTDHRDGEAVQPAPAEPSTGGLPPAGR